MNKLKIMVGSVELKLKGEKISESEEYGVVFKKYVTDNGETVEEIIDAKKHFVGIWSNQ